MILLSLRSDTGKMSDATYPTCSTQERRELESLVLWPKGLEKWHSIPDRILRGCDTLYYVVRTRCDDEATREKSITNGKNSKQVYFPVQMDVLRYLVEERGLTSTTACHTALEYGHIDAAEYLHTHGSPASARDHIYNLEAMKWAHSHNLSFEPSAVRSILLHCSYHHTVERLLLLLEWYPSFIDIVADKFVEYDRNHDKILLPILEKYWDSCILLQENMKKHLRYFCEHAWKGTVSFLYEKGIDLSPYVQYMGLTRDAPYLEKWRNIYSMPIEIVRDQILPMEDEWQSDYLIFVEFYASLIPSFTEFAQEHNLVEKCMDLYLRDVAAYLLAMFGLCLPDYDKTKTAREILAQQWNSYCEHYARGHPEAYREYLVSLTEVFTEHFDMSSFAERYKDGYPNEEIDGDWSYGNIEEYFEGALESTEWRE